MLDFVFECGKVFNKLSAEASHVVEFGICVTLLVSVVRIVFPSTTQMENGGVKRGIVVSSNDSAFCKTAQLVPV